MGKVYLAFDEKLHRQVALKVLLTSDPSDAQRMVREARAVAAVEHPNKITIYELGEDSGVPFIAMELIRGPTLRAFVDDRSTSWKTAARHLIDVARALAAAHAAGLVHRDVKPENAMVREDGVVKVLDFGIARRSSTDVTATGTTAPATDSAVIGTAAYMAPEQVRGEELDGRCDQFAWAVMAFELFTGEHPWGPRTDALRLVSTMLTKPPLRLDALRPDLPNPLSVIVARALSADRDARFATMTDVIDALTAVLEEGRTDPSASALTEPAPSPPPKHVEAPSKPSRIRFVVPVIAVAAAAATGFWYANRSAPNPKPEPRYRCHADLEDRGVVECAPSSFLWCDAAGHRIACCASGLVPTGREGACGCPPLASKESLAHGCKDAPDAKLFSVSDASVELRRARESVAACFHDDTNAPPARLGFLVDFSPEGETASVRILRSDSPDPDRQACALRALRSMHGWATRSGASAWEMDWVINKRYENGYGYEFNTEIVNPAPPPPLAVPEPLRGRMPPQAALNTINAAFPKLSHCYDVAREKSPSLAGRVILGIVIGATGRVDYVQLYGSNVGESSLPSCLSGVVSALEFPPAQAGVSTVVIPLDFGQSGGD